MKKIMMLLLLLCVMVLAACDAKEESKTDYSEYSFTDTRWVRDNGHDLETIRFNADGSFTYSCACGNPVNDSDLCEKYTYDDTTKEIKLDYIETTEETISTIKIVKSTEDILELDFDGEIRKFNKE